MGTVGIKIKIMPESPDTNLEEIEKKVRGVVEGKGGKNRDYSIEEVAFGLKSITAFFELPEEIEPSVIEEHVKNIAGISSIQIIDVRRLI